MTDSPRSSLADEHLWIAAVTASASAPGSLLGTPFASARTSIAEAEASEVCDARGRSYHDGPLTGRHSTGLDGSFEALSLLDAFGREISFTGRAGDRSSNMSGSTASYQSSRPVSAVSSTSSMAHDSQGLIKLNYSGNRLSVCPADVPSAVVTLNLSFNNLTSIPISFLQPLCDLRVLDLSGNGLRMLPRDIGIYLYRLRELRLSKNRLEFLPPSIAAMEDLELLDLGWNMLELIDPRLFQNMRKLRHLWLQHNRLQSLPPSIGLLSDTLTDVLLDGNPFSAPMDELVAPLLLLGGNSSGIASSGAFAAVATSGHSDQSSSRQSARESSGSVKNLLRKSPSMEGKNHGGRKHWQRARMALARTRTKSLVVAAAAPFLSGHHHEPVPPVPPVPPMPHDSSSMGHDMAAHAADPRAGKGGRNILSRMRKMSVSGVRLDDMLGKSPNSPSTPPPVPPLPSLPSLPPQNSSFLLPTRAQDERLTDDDVAPDAYESDADGPSRGTPQRRKPLSLGINFRRSPGHSPSRSPQLTPSRSEDSYPLLTGTNGTLGFFDVAAHLMSTMPSNNGTPRDVKSDASGTIGEKRISSCTDTTQMVTRDSGYGADARHSTAGTEDDYDEEAMSSSIFSDSDRAALETVDDPFSSSEVGDDNVSDEVAALAAATKAAFMRRTRNANGALLRQRSSSPVLHETFAANGTGSANTGSLSGTCSPTYLRARVRSGSMTGTAPTSPLASEPMTLSMDGGMRSNIDMHLRRKSDSAQPLTSSELAATAGISPLPLTLANSESSLMRGASSEVFAPADAFGLFGHYAPQAMTPTGSVDTVEYPSGTIGMSEHAVQRRLALKRLLGHLRDLWDLGVGVSVMGDNGVPVRLLESQPDAAVPEEIIGNRPVSLDVTGLLRLAERRRRIVEEIVATERTYVQELTSLEKLYLRPAVQRSALSAEEVRTVFGNIESLAMFHREHLLPRLEEACEKVEPGSEPPIGQVFMDHCAYIKMYSVYVNNFEHAHAALDKWEAGKSHKRWRQVMEEARHQRVHTQLNIQGYLVMPVQRIPRYRLLLQELFDHTPRSHPDYQCLKAALEEISKRADEINERKRDHEQSALVLSLQRRIKGSEKLPLLQPHRRFVREFSLRSVRESRLHTMRRTRLSQTPAVTIRQRRIDKEYLFFLFSDVLLQCKVHGHLNKETELVRCVYLGGRRNQVEYSEVDNEVRIVDEDVILYVAGAEDDLRELVRSVATR
ncbi:hypothetical protein THASP1DRAFT_31529 [Thamnocephalis sphaerospora]|uniref:DH domain-containing protein n=1 Tax=Thamnocephalis sphaerospora TaxID=78915 RepID=A0A4P9XLC4_9FUNG|nr:hypothetical protein THASP1DRAFT_31529 [Thamnocephalis sphaerospora]|eukprot:RKP06657.1 hypothetical protein THASP1DRAFT_31529 [Thamnocephalis sphaerospora]